MAEERDFENGWKWKEFKLSRARDLDLDLRSGHTAYRRASLKDLYLYTKFHSNWRNFLWTDVRTDGRTFFPSILLGRLSEVDLIINGDSGCRLCTDYTHSLSRLAWSWVGDCLAPFYIHQMNRMNSDNGSAMTTAPETLARIIRSTS